ncbi:MAG: tetraacyldisaccharide 4'-kinase [Ignavibacteria bacterium]|nr:tetraacyldisaccharide 4'-kinase [Ignavibacteria bacterium]
MFQSFLSSIITVGVQLRNKLFDTKLIKQVQSKFPVVSIGNLSFGGTGKTPLTIYISNFLKENNWRPIIISRGYRRKGKGLGIVRTETEILTTWNLAGDEMFLIATKLDVPIVVCSNKHKSIEFIEKKFDFDVVIVDDGFQHRKLFRNIDILLIDKRTVERPFVAPKGFLREPFGNYRRADIILIEKGIDYIFENLKAQNKFYYFKEISSVFLNNTIKVELSYLKTIPLIALSGIANNNKFYESLRNLGLNIIKHHKFSDHFLYRTSDLIRVIEDLKKYRVNNLITTEKDWVKLEEFQNVFSGSEINVFVARLDIKIVEENGFRETLLSKLSNYSKAK